MIPEARLEQQETGLAPVSDGWFVVGIREAAWVHQDNGNAVCVFEGDTVSFPQIGYSLAVLQPGETSGLYHREAGQEDFLVLSGECLLIVEGEERRLQAWDFFHCPPGCEHALLGAGDGPCVIFMTGSRATWPAKGIVYPRSEAALRHGVGVEEETTNPREANAGRSPWRTGPPESFEGLPWA